MSQKKTLTQKLRGAKETIADKNTRIDILRKETNSFKDRSLRLYDLIFGVDEHEDKVFTDLYTEISILIDYKKQNEGKANPVIGALREENEKLHHHIRVALEDPTLDILESTKDDKGETELTAPHVFTQRIEHSGEERNFNILKRRY